MYSLKVLGYVKIQGTSKFNQDGSIIVQEMFYGNASGVLFTENGSNQMNLAYNLSWENTTVEGDISNNFTIDKSGEDFKNNLPDNLPLTIFKVIDAAIILEQQEKRPLDIEWAVAGKKAAILQFRPITMNQLDYTIEWDNTNIAESYPGITLPLTYSFIRRLYSKVYPEFLKLLGRSNKELSDQADIFNNMLGYIHGRVYYNINNWYRLVGLLPGYKYNKDFFESMLMPAKKKINQKQQKRNISLAAKLNLIIAAAKFALLLLQTDNLSNKFILRYLPKYKRYKSVLWEELSAIGIINTYEKIEKDLLEQWAVPILNDFRTMVFHGILRKFFFPKNNDDLYVRLLSGIYDHTSVEPIRELGVLAGHVRIILVKFKGNQEAAVKAILDKEQYRDIRKQIEKYLLEYGGRSPDELKLENPRLGENLDSFASFIVASADGYSENINLTGKKNTGNVENEICFNKSPIMNFFLKPFFNYILHQAKRGISKRERFRFYRAQVFGIARDAYLALGNHFVDASLIEKIDDIFYLTISEIQDVVLGHSFDNSFRVKINERKKIFSDFEKQNIARRVVSSGIVSPLNISADVLTSKSGKKNLTGLGVSGGIFEGRIVVVRKFDPKINVEGKILVAEHTDPGWTLLFLNAKALIVERGNALSHASIVSREIGISAVVAVENACSVLKNGDNVAVNGSTGEITIL